MSRHWNPDRDLARARARDSAPRPHWPHGATAGVALVAAACVGMALLLYHLAGPRDIFGS